MPPNNSASKSDPAPPPRKRKWRRRLLITGLLLLILGALANGPGARWFIHRTIRAELAKLGMEGDLRVEGRLHSGFTLLDGDFNANSSDASVSFDELIIKYELLELLNKKVRRIEGQNIKVVAVATGIKDTEKKPLPDFEVLGAKLRDIRKLVRPVSIDVEQVHYRLLHPRYPTVDYHLASIKHPANSDAFTITGFHSNALGAKGLPLQDIRLRWEDEDLALDRLVIFPDLTLSTAQVNYAPGSPVELFASVTALSSQLIGFADSNGTIELDLRNDSLDLATTAARFAPDLELSGKIPHLHLRADNLLGTPDTWEVTANVKGTDLAWKDGQLDALSADLILGDRARLITDLGEGLKAHLDLENPLRKAAPEEGSTWWKDLNGTIKLEAASIHDALRKGFIAANKELPPLTNIPTGSLNVDAAIETSGPLDIQISKATWQLTNSTISEKPLPDLKGNLSLQETTAAFDFTLAEPRNNELFEGSATYRILSSNYKASLDVNLPDTEWLEPFQTFESPPWRTTNELILTWNGEGSVRSKQHEGSTEIKQLTLTPINDPGTTFITLTAEYDWPKSIKILSLSAHNGDLWLDGGIQWTDNRLSIPILRVHDDTGPLVTFKGGLPLSPEHLSADKILQTPGALDLSLKIDELLLDRLDRLLHLDLPEDLAATLHTDLNIGGSFAAPTLAGQIRTNSVKLPSTKSLPVLDAELNLETRDNTLHASGTVTEPAGQILSLSGKLPLNIGKWIENPDTLQSLTLDANAKVNQLALSRLQILEPSLATTEGSLSADLTLSGTVSEPKFTGTANATMKRYPLPVATFREVRDTSLNLKLEDDRIIIEPSTATIAGGEFTLSGDISLAEDEPTLALRLNADHALLWRNDSFIFRSNGNLALDGPWSQARLSGSLNLVESLFYKDIEIIPIGVPANNAPKPKLPKIDHAKVAKAFDIPEPFKNWTLDLSLKTEDSILIRGNVAEGTITADTRIGGTLSAPRPSGKFLIKKASADLPFSTLSIKNGNIILNPDDPLNPTLDIRGTSTVDSQRVNLYLYGSLSSPKYNLSSDRGLAENEVLTLLATGTSAADLEDPEIAKTKAFQVFIDNLRRRANKPGGNKYFREILNELDDVNLKVGENDPFSGRKFNSATLQVEDRWFLSAAVDDEGNTRGLVIFSMRFK